VKYFKDNTGQSLVEVVVAVGAMSLLLVALLSLVVLAIKNSRMAKDRTQAVALAQGGVELMRAYRDFSWIEFSGAARFNEYGLSEDWTVETGLFSNCNDVDLISDLYRRCVRVQMVAPPEVAEVAVRVAWQEGSQWHETIQTTRLSVWAR